MPLTPLPHPVSPDKAQDSEGAFRSFGGWILACVILLNAVAFWYGIYNLQNNRQQYDEEARIQTQNIALALDQSISNAADKINQSLRAAVFELERQLALDSLDHKVLRHIIEQQRVLLPESIGFRIFNSEGTPLLGSAHTSNPTAKVADRDYFVALKSRPDGEMYVSKPVISRFTRERVIAFAARFNHPDGSFAGVVTIPISTHYFEQLASRFVLGSGGVIALRDLDLNLITRHPTIGPKETEQTLPATDDLTRLIRSGTTHGTYRTTHPEEGIPRLLSFRRVEKAPMYALAGLSEDHYLTRWRDDFRETLAFISLFAIVTSLSGLMLYRAWRKQLRANLALQKSNRQLEQLFKELHERDNALLAAQTVGGLGTYRHDIQRDHFTSSSEMDAIFGIDASYPHTFDGWLNLVHPEDRPMMEKYFQNEVIAQKQVFNINYRIIRPADKRIVWVHGYGKLEYSSDGQPLSMSGVILDITERRQYEEQLQLANEVFLNTRESIIITDENGAILNVNPAFTDITGYERAEAIGQNPSMLQSGRQNKSFYQQMWHTLKEQDYWEGEFQNRRKDGRLYTQSSKVSAVRNEQGRIVRIIAVASDVTQIRASQKQIQHLAFHDKLTDLPNRAKLANQLVIAIQQAKQTQTLLGVCYLDLDGFKQLNDAWGHDIGDLVLVEVALRLQSSVNPDDMVARLGGDEFIVLLGGAAEIGHIEQTLTHILAELAKPFRIGKFEAELSASIGVALYPDDIDDADILIRRADQAMYIAKHQGKNRFHLFDSEMDRRLRAQQELQQRVAQGIVQDEFRLFYQPKVNMATGEIIGAEALARWQHPERGLLPPSEFLHVTENSEVAIELGEWVIRRALKQIAAWSSDGLHMPVSVNIDGYHLQRPDFVQRLAALLEAEPAVLPTSLQLEILETSAMENIDAVSHIINACQQLGVSFALDDFGTGYSSLTYFRRLPTKVMKIDRSFVLDMLNDEEDFALVEGIVTLARSFHRDVIAEGVESVEHGMALMKIGCELGQGFGIARPMSDDIFRQWAKEWRMPEPWRELTATLRLHTNNCEQTRFES